jgi:CarD family transcriptional regulator
MQTGSLLDAAQVLKTLLALHREKPLSFREKRLMERARHMLLSEISLARGVPEVHAVNLLERSLAKAGLTLPPPN